MANHLESLPLWEALDCPARRAGVPGARCREWARCRAALRTHLRRVGCTREVRSPSALWLATGRRSPCPGACPAGTTWGDLCDGYTVGQVAAALAATGTGGAPRVCSWNARWLVDAQSDTNAAKRAFICGRLAEGKVVLLQETHWSAADIGIWSGLFPGTEVAASAARVGPGGGPQGGVAILVPAHLHIVQWTVIEPACAVEAHLAPNGCSNAVMRVQSLYFPPADRHRIVQAYAGAAMQRTTESAPPFRHGRR